MGFILTPESYRQIKLSEKPQSQKMEEISKDVDFCNLSNEFRVGIKRSNRTLREENMYKPFADSPLKSTTLYGNGQSMNYQKSQNDIFQLEDKLPFELTPIRQDRDEHEY